MKWLVIQTRLSVHARLSTANIIKIFIKTHDHWEKRASIRQRIHCYLICHWNWSPYFFPSFFSAGALLKLTISITKLFWKFAVWRCVDDLGKDIYRFHVRYIHSSFYLICSIVNVYFVTSQNNVCFRMMFKHGLYITRWPEGFFGFISVSS